MEKKLKILLLEDTKADAELIEMELHNANLQFENILVDTKQEFITALNQFTPDIILADHSVASFNSMEALKIVKENGIASPFVVVTTALPEKLADNILNEGASDFVLKGNLHQLPDAIKKALNKYSFEEQGIILTTRTPVQERLYDLSLLEEMDDIEYTTDILSIFLNETPKELTEMQKAVTAGQIDVVGGKAHKLKSSTGLIQADALLNILKTIELGAKSNSNDIVKLVDCAQKEYKKIEVSLKEYLKNI